MCQGMWLSFYHRATARLDTCDADRLLVFGHRVRPRIASWQQTDGEPASPNNVDTRRALCCAGTGKCIDLLALCGRSILGTL